MTLYLIGMGIAGIKGISVEGLEIAKKCDKVYLETYTSPLEITLSEVEEFLGRKVEKLSREELERADKIISESKGSNVAILTPGDPLIATTHFSIVIEATRRGIRVKVVHSASIYSAAIGESGLHVYKFGKTVTLAKLYGSLPFSVYETIFDNKRRGLHTLVLLQQDLESKEIIYPDNAINILLDLEKKQNKGVLREDDIVIVLSRIGYDDCLKLAGKVVSVMRRIRGLKLYPAVIIIPGELHFTEKEALKTYWIEEKFSKREK